VYIFELSPGVTEPPVLSLVLLVSPVPGSSARPPEAPGSSVPHLRQQQHPTPPLHCTINNVGGDGSHIVVVVEGGGGCIVIDVGGGGCIVVNAGGQCMVW